VRVPSCAWVMLLTIARPRPTPAWPARMRSVPRRNARQRGNYLWVSFFAGVLDREHHALVVNAGRDPHGALLRQIVDDRVLHEVRSICSRSGCEPMVGVTSPEVSMVRPRSSAREGAFQWLLPR